MLCGWARVLRVLAAGAALSRAVRSPSAAPEALRFLLLLGGMVRIVGGSHVFRSSAVVCRQNAAGEN
jgi:hypothetical protein